MMYAHHVRYGEKLEPVRMTLTKAVLHLVFAIPSIAVMYLITGLVFLLNMLQVGMTHITFKVEYKPALMPDGSIRQPPTVESPKYS